LPGRKLIGLRFMLKLDQEALFSLIQIASKHRIIPVYFSSSPSVLGDAIPVLTFLDITESNTPFDEVISELKSTGMLGDIHIIEPAAEGLMIDNLSHPLTAGGDRAIILRAGGYRRLIKGIKEQFGTGGDAFLYYQGLEAGIGFGNLHRAVAEAVGIKDPVEVYRRISTASFQWAGFGKVDIIHLGDSGGKLAIYDSFECRDAKVTGQPYGSLVRGIIAGVFSAVFGKSFWVEETECLAKGDSRCVFEIRPK